MSQATDLLNSLTDDQISAYSTGAGEEPHIVIGDDRRIVVPNSLKRIAVQYDHDVETVTFDCPRYWDNLDMSKMAIYINYILSDGYADSYPAKDVVVDGDIMHFTWTISRNLTQVAGHVTFLVCIKKSDSQGIEVNHWNSELCKDMYVSEGLETEEQIALENTDLITQLLLRMNSVEQINIQADEMRTLRDDTQGLVSDAGEIYGDMLETEDRINNSAAEIRNSYANAIKGEVSGEIVRVDDVSPLEHDVKVKAHGKNMVKMDFIAGESSTDRSVIQKDGNTVIFPAVDGNIYGFYMSNTDLGMKPGKTYTASIGNISAFASASYGWRLRYTDGSTVTLPHSNTATFTLEKELDKIIFRVGSPFSGNTESRIEGIQIEEGSVATEYEPYVDPSTIKVTACGENLINAGNLATQQTGYYSNVTLVASNNGGRSITIEGADGASSCANSSGWLVLNAKSLFNLRTDDEITISADVTLVEEGIYGNTIKFAIMNNTAGLTSSSSSLTLGDKQRFIATRKVQADGLHRFVIMVNSNKITVENIMVSLNGVTVFEDYAGASYTPNADGTCTVASVSPTMTLLSSTVDAIIEATYNRDTTKMFESYVLTDKAKDEIAGLVKNDISAEVDAIEATLDEIIALQESLT